MYSDLQTKQNGKYIYTLTTPQVDSIPLMDIHGAVGVGKGIIGFPHTASTMMNLMDLGFKDVPHPMDNSLVWTPKGKFKPFDYQLETGKYITSHANSWVLSGLGCVDSETEYLSPTGWMKISEYKGDKVAQYDPDTEVATFVEPEQYIKEPCDYMYRLNSARGLDQMLSPEHKVLLHKKGYDRVYTHTAHELAGRTVNSNKEYGVPTAFNLHTDFSLDIDYPTIRLMVAVIADGWFRSPSTSHVIIRLKKQRKIDRMHYLLKKSRVDYQCSPCLPDGFMKFKFYAPWREKSFGVEWYSANHAERKVIIDEVKHWDSNVSVRKNTTAIRFSSSIKESAEFIQWCACSTGLTASRVNTVRERRGGIETEYLCHIYDRHQSKHITGVSKIDGENIRHSNISKCKSTDGFKYCFTVPTGFLVMRRNGCVFLTGNSGKTASCIWAAEFLRETKEAHKILILCPLSTVERVWVKEIFDLYPEKSVGVVTGNKTQKLNILRRDYDYYVVNHDGIRQQYILEELKQACPDIIILDEATAMKNGGTSRYEALKELYDHCGPKLWAVTATPAPNGPQDMFAMQKLIDPDTVPNSLTAWKSTTMWKVDRFKWVPRKGHEKIVEAAMQPAIRFMRDDIPKIGKPVEYNAPLTDEQMKVFIAVRDEMIAEVQHQKDHTILAVNAAVKLSKLLQICSGNVYDINKDVVMLPNPDRLAILDAVLEQAGAMSQTKVIIFVPFKNAQLQIEKYLTSKKYSTVLVNGDTPKNKRGDIFRHFQESVNPRVLVAHPKVAAHGLTLTAASVVMWYGPHFSLELYLQGNGRIARIGQEQDLTLVHVGSHDIEWQVYDILRKRGATQNAVLSMYDRIIRTGKV